MAGEFGGNARSRLATSTLPGRHDFWRGGCAILQNLKIVDPATGSGAFLFQAYNVLDSRYNEVIAKHLTIAPGAEDSATSWPSGAPHWILSGNLYGVDLSQEAVEITPLAVGALRSGLNSTGRPRGQRRWPPCRENIVHTAIRWQAVRDRRQVHPFGLRYWREAVSGSFQPPASRLRLRVRQSADRERVQAARAGVLLAVPRTEIVHRHQRLGQTAAVGPKVESDDPAAFTSGIKRRTASADAAAHVLPQRRSSILFDRARRYQPDTPCSRSWRIKSWRRPAASACSRRRASRRT